MRLRLAALGVCAVACSSCILTTVQDPVALGSDHRLTITTPAGLSEQATPVAVSWSLAGGPAPRGDHFGVFLDVAPPGVGQVLRLTVCTDNGLLPPPPGATRSPCHDQRYRVVETTATSYVFRCVPAAADGSMVPRGWHEVAVVLLDGSDHRVGKAVATSTFRVTGSGGSVTGQYGQAGAGEGCAAAPGAAPAAAPG